MVSAKNEIQTVHSFSLTSKSWASCSHVPALAGKLETSKYVGEKECCQGSHMPAYAKVAFQVTLIHMLIQETSLND